MYNILIKMPRRYILKEEGRAMGAAQIIIALIHCALGILCYHLFVRQERIQNTGSIPVSLTIIYAFCTIPFFITTGSTNVEAQKKATRRAFVAAIFMNILSACIAAVGVLILTIACFTYEAKTHEYIWSQMAGSMLLQFLLFSAISELILAGLLVSWIVKALHRAECNDDTSLQIEEISCSIDSSGCSLSECSSIHL
ncbi:hypothetical protein HJG60_011392 [Phyllostomus discolor]|uniref:Uncharacterized protein n=1 Tax=Phyllostomus discolor TaxID=89673 RepID=A0A833ZWT3_9CHIR|nr:hypothetical protein HJG60_011392 [Phyllostomus discolor]